MFRKTLEKTWDEGRKEVIHVLSEICVLEYSKKYGREKSVMAPNISGPGLHTPTPGY